MIDYVKRDTPMVEYYIAALDGTRGLGMSMHVEADKLAALKPGFDAVLDSVKLKSAK